MRRILFYLSVALVAFGIGSFVAFNVYWATEEKLISSEEISFPIKIQLLEPTGKGFGTGYNNKNSKAPVYTPKLHRPTCNDKKLLPIWNELRKDKEFKKGEKEFYQTGNCSELIEIDKVDLNDDGQKEFIVWGRYTFSGAAGNCVFWIYEKKNGKFRQLLQSYALKDGDEEWFKVNKIKSNGFRNILLKGHFSGYETTEHYYEFNGKHYTEKKCLFMSYYPDEKNPSILTCREAWKR